jgi:hypothetical protein
VTWQHVDDPRVVEYRVAAVAAGAPRRRRPAGAGLGHRRQADRRLPDDDDHGQPAWSAGSHYVFWLDAVITNGVVTKEPMIGRSNAVLVQ